MVGNRSSRLEARFIGLSPKEAKLYVQSPKEAKSGGQVYTVCTMVSKKIQI